jgi:hypothetical protein
MRLNLDKWTFIQHSSKPTIDTKEVLYWKGSLKKLLKVGMEFEYNLPDSNGTCKGNSNVCPCVKMATNDCWKECANKAKCDAEKNYDKCLARAEKCKPEDCKNCPNYVYECPGVFCTNFVTKCFNCSDFVTDCANCKNRYDPSKNPEYIRNKITAELTPNNCYGYINESGVHSITTDGSLLGKQGAEVITIGRRVDYWEFYKMSKNIIQNVTTKGAYLNERCSLHMHLLASYYGKLFPSSSSAKHGIPENISELERPMPEIILANFHQLVRRYQNALTWMGMSLDIPNKMTRWEKFRVSVLQISAIMNDMRSVQEQVSSHSGNNKYGFVNYKYCQFNRSGDITRFHIEMRNLDGMNSPSAVAAFACLYYALVLKAVEISRHGIVEIGDSEWFSYALKVKDAILNNVKGYQEGDRFSDTSKLYQYNKYLIAESLDLVRQLKHILIKIGPAYQVLEQLAESPIAIRRCNGDTWEKIETDLSVPTTNETELEATINEFIDLRLIDSCNSLSEWVTAVGKVIRQNTYAEVEETDNLEERVLNYVIDKKENGELIWSNTLGTAVLL